MSGLPKVYLYKRSNGVYYIGYFGDGRKRWKSTGATERPHALSVLTNLKRLLQASPPLMSFSQFSQDFLAYAEGNYSPKTVTVYRGVLERLRAIVGDTPLVSIAPQQIDFYKTARLQIVSPVSVNIELRTLRAAFNVALRWGLIERNPLAGIRLTVVPEQAPTFLSKTDFQKLISIIREDWLRKLVMLAVLTGMRRGELVNLRWQDVDLVRKLIHIQSNPTFRTKHGKLRTIPLSEVACHLLNGIRLCSTSDYVFTLNGRKLTEGWVSHKFKYWVYEAKLANDKLHFHSLRHTFASWLVQEGVSLYEVQKLLGHSNISVTQVYSHLQPEFLHATVNRITVQLN